MLIPDLMSFDIQPVDGAVSVLGHYFGSVSCRIKIPHPFVHFFSVNTPFAMCLLPYFVDAVNVSSRNVMIRIVMNVVALETVFVS